MKTRNLVPILFLLFAACGKKSSSGPEAAPKLSVADMEIIEGTGGTKNLEINLTLDKGSSTPVTLNYSTVDVSAKGGQDFTAVANQLVTFAPNVTTQKILIAITPDDGREPDETFQIRLSNPSNVWLLRETITITIKNDDTKIAFNNAGFDAPTSYAGYTLAWQDEFNGSSLDPAFWTAEIGDGCPNCGWGNNELQYYTNPPNNLLFQDGKMLIEARAESFGGKSHTSTRIITRGKKSFKFGRIDIRALLPKGKGLWPALWMMPQDNVFGGWPRSGEIDIMEYIGSETSRVLGTVHYGPGPNSTYTSRNYTLPSGTFNDEFHVFSLEWSVDQIKWYVDGNLFSTFNKADVGALNWPFNESFFFIINMAVGGNLPGAPDASTAFPAWFIVDYVRIYQK